MAMKIHHLNCATMCPLGASWIQEEGFMVCHCLLIETDQGLVLVDTGLGREDLAYPNQRLGRIFKWSMRPHLNVEETAARQIQKLGFEPSDVRHIVLTHLDIDHAGALSDFPKATVHVYGDEFEAAHNPDWDDFLRYSRRQWAHEPQWETYKDEGDQWFDFHTISDLKGLPPEILLVPLVGHSTGHCGVAVKGESKWLLHCGDAYFHRREVHPTNPRCPRLLKVFQTLLQKDKTARLYNQKRLRKLAENHEGEVSLFCAHDPREFARFQE